MTTNEAIKAAEDAAAEGLLGKYPMAARVLAQEVASLQYLDDEASHGASELTNKIREINVLANHLWGWANMMPPEHDKQLSKIIDLTGGMIPGDKLPKCDHKWQLVQSASGNESWHECVICKATK